MARESDFKRNDREKEDKIFRSAVGYDHKTNELIRELTTGNLNKTTVECKCKLTEH
jgi:hypothetical protein